ncbi:cysteine synthase [Actinoplanes sp. SE50]|uniref:2,3-diaminopropionate biosynthesis protein SbnA n=1 Tax=unclassified Actinoplanes TaxID=2626549 RepID=UPI00023ED60D|nr:MULTISPECIES: 2,3-diaminopropionate biosynthesis protein SbnA [unclassified Actinoplanes]AEV85017.1 cysteine synthase A [Actinoplanes sp. SE50/110]ATO83408.1 cysteine synthase [Actinoplanes sp. SE50]SLM00815.1 2,3-diaminopropionate biosynthesis protein SbnA [Actinoplanes sp. SE50/110]
MKTPAFASGITGTIGATPLVELTRLGESSPLRVFAKLEGHNPGGSIKDRSALEMIRHGVAVGRIVPGRSVVVESSSGNLGIGLAQVCAYYGVRFVCVTDPRANQQNIAIMRALGAEVEVVTRPDPATGEFLPARIARVRELAAALPGGYCPDQYSSPLNPQAHHATMREIVEALPAPPDVLFCSTGSFGTLRGCAEYAREQRLAVRIVAVDAVGSTIFGTPRGPRVIPGHGAAVRPALFRDGLADEVVHVDDAACVVGCRRLVALEAILAGGSSGAVVAALDRVRDRIAPGSSCVLIFPDRGERYLDTIYDDDWVAERFGDIAHLWKQNAMEASPC